MKPYAYYAAGAVAALILTVGLAACQSQTASPVAPTAEPPTFTPPATATPLPSFTALPTATPPATPTPTPTEPTATPAGSPTPDPNLGVGEIIYEDHFDGASGWMWFFEDDSVVFSIADNQLNAAARRSGGGPRWSVRPDKVFGNHQLRVTGRVFVCHERDEYGLLFRANADANNGYVFKLNCRGEARLERLVDYQAQVIVDWTPAAGIVAGAPAENSIVIWAAGDQFNFYVNDRYIFSARDAVYKDGICGFYLRDRSEGSVQVGFKDMIIREVKLP